MTIIKNGCICGGDYYTTTEQCDNVECRSERKTKWIFTHGGECGVCHRPELTELNKNDVCFQCWEEAEE